eukprot:c32478_g1_i1.p1 GENE.c32478_g1_i1~~c32478_g1_i1.p1  ORF type:complete len:236 (+),score=66.61 c32478_g1_i1:54-761(+)
MMSRFAVLVCVVAAALAVDVEKTLHDVDELTKQINEDETLSDSTKDQAFEKLEEMSKNLHSLEEAEDDDRQSLEAEVKSELKDLKMMLAPKASKTHLRHEVKKTASKKHKEVKAAVHHELKKTAHKVNKAHLKTNKPDSYAAKIVKDASAVAESLSTTDLSSSAKKSVLENIAHIKKDAERIATASTSEKSRLREAMKDRVQALKLQLEEDEPKEKAQPAKELEQDDSLAAEASD